ncbi:MAG: biotin-dependent carboxyltransferase family protein [Clostridium sp.]|nr:biotin-dependent carboxyltransferase family protein [Clostridium sp.]
MGVKFANGGFLTTVQDMGRIGFQESGMSVSGVMDQRSAALANLLVGNDENEAVLEITLMGPMCQFTEDNIIAVTGGNLGPKLNGKDLPMYQAVRVKKGDNMSFAGMFSGSRAYVAFAGGLDIPVVMGSKSTNLKSRVGGYQGRKLGGGDEIGFIAPKTTLPNMGKRKVTPDDFTATEQVIRVVLGPQDDCFTEKGLKTFLSETYTFTNESDRMGCRLEGEVIEHKNGGDIITDGIAFGAIQVPSHGKPIIMMADHQTTGGYTKIAAVISVDLPKVAQSRPGNKVRFQAVSVEEAQKLYIAQKKEFAALKEEFSKEPQIAAELSAAIQAAVAHEARKYWKKAGKYRVIVDGNEFIVELSEESEGLR